MLCAKTVATVSRLVLLSAGFMPCTEDQHASKLAGLVCLPFDCSCASTRSHPLPLGKFLALLSLLQSSGSARFTCFVSLLSVLLRLSCALVRRYFVSLSARERSVFYFTPFLPGSELVCFAAGCCVVPAGALVISLHLFLTTKMVSVYVHFPSSRYFVAFVCVFCVILCVSVLVINRSVAGVVCPVAGVHCPVAGVILTVVEENHPIAVVACPVARVMQNCVAQVTSKSTVIGSLVDCPLLAE